MIAALDVYYSDEGARAAAVVFRNWQSSEAAARYVAFDTPAQDYRPGQFYARELPPLLKVIGLIEESVDAYVIDGYCHLSSALTPGLGARLGEALPEPATIVGVAKNRYHRSGHAVEVLRAGSRRPLFVTSIGIAYEDAARRVESMAGAYRIPDLLKAVDRLSREGVPVSGH